MSVFFCRLLFWPLAVIMVSVPRVLFAWESVLLVPEELPIGQAKVCEFLVYESDCSLGSKLMWQGKSIPLFFTDKGNATFSAEVLISADLEDALGVQDVGVFSKQGRELAHADVLIVPRTFEEQHLTLPSKMVSPGKQSLDRHWAERKKVRSVLDEVTPAGFWSLPLARPVPGSISSTFGLRRILNGQPGSAHKGVDLRGAQGTPVVSCADGVVALVGDHYFSGRTVYIDHGQGVVSMYAHLSEISVRQGDRVTRGEKIGAVGSTGRATGPHLHFGLIVLGRSVDPIPLMDRDK